ncbi:glycosyltransferase, partial [Pseudorhizobium flavum]|uniref:glycosyltransferase n=1 Tax=Pseudorhizobium flavum TaxID=1335061 RepID=UPI001AECFACD
MLEMMQNAFLAEQQAAMLSCETVRPSPELSVIVPTFNEAPNVELVVGACPSSNDLKLFGRG